MRSHEVKLQRQTPRKTQETMNKDLKDYVYLDTMWLQEKQLLKLAMNVGSYQMAEHYLCAYLFDAVAKGKREALLEVNKVREHYGAQPIPLSQEDMQDDYELRGKMRVSAEDEQARRIFLKLKRAEKIDVLRSSMSQLLLNHHLFIKTRHWLAIFMVVRDRLLGESLNQISFIDLAEEISPEELPRGLRMSKSTSKNFSREIIDEDRGEVYYKMKCNPQKLLCDTFWSIVRMTILTEF